MLRLATAGAYASIVLVGLDDHTIDVTRFAVVSAPFLAFLGALAVALLRRRG